MRFAACILLFLAVSCTRKEAEPAPTATAVEEHHESRTLWTARTEVFADFPALVQGATSRFAVHVTDLDSFRPIPAGRVSVSLAGTGAASNSFTVEQPTQPGVFPVDVKPTVSGVVRLKITFTGSTRSEVFDLGDVTIANAKTVHSETAEDPGDTIAFSKEQQWSLDFRTEAAASRVLRTSIDVPGEIHPRSGGEAEVTAPFDGRLLGASLPIVGALVTQGQVLAQVLPPTSTPSDMASLELARREATLSLQLARKDRQRAERLVQSGAAPAKRVDEARTVEATAAARVETAETRLAQYEASSTAGPDAKGVRLFAIRAPITGIVTESAAAPNTNIKTGTILFRIVDADSVYVSAVVPESEASHLRGLRGAELQIPGTEHPRALTRLISLGRVVDPTTRTLPVLYQFDNRDRSVAIHQAVAVRLFTGAGDALPVVPESALVDHDGRPVVFVQTGGEAFVRRDVVLGGRENGSVQIRSGVQPGERVVTRGAHLIRLSSLSGAVPAEGHVH